ncbi:tRNA uridine(34) 5-carboxymethylaminomethyl modification radical SAM/GNAT enzyme Elp3 [Methanobacterium alcaliphilum]|uniref:tRNA uridine(34) 5-carboxymethylaminomethyl modification radical SAM/GNAT enzyme Elp3 n=1 Tax=Methanobacterium alcaliphilum TaxID=392018 RepID=UPI00200B2689|nr:tRNA uridine(34) 5-carboxymethylaminomethyl modification radical SAM/GNAT enzyme Elp3 [Methanobacterium alcaliphilum]MCK9150885.1 tRNA uridine(34) 5-carboxymethylaminomethyl modification radical SAM/GNAT enzyme Elp3 [Methanobacterium alcaliphilum]
MEDACRLIIDQILQGKIQSKDQLEKVKHKACRDFKLEKFMSNSMILNYASMKEKKEISDILKKKPTRTISGVAIVAVMCQPQDCPHGRCLYCPESEKAPPSYTGEEPAALRARMYKFDPYEQVYNRLHQLHSIGHSLDKVELIVMGGTFPAHILCYQEWFVSKCLQAMVDFGIDSSSVEVKHENVDIKHQKLKNSLIPKYEPTDYILMEDAQKANESANIRCVGITFETRPDYCRIEDVDRMLSMGVTRVELGVQTLYNFIYQRIKRGHSIEDVVNSNQVLRDSGIKVAMHLMPGLFSDFERDLRIFKKLFSDSRFKPDMLKIYPCLVTKGSKMHEMWENGEYEPYNSKEAVDLIVEIKKMLPKWVRTMRIQRDIPSPLIEAGVKKSNLGELVYNKLSEEGVQCQCIRCREVGHQLAQGKTPNNTKIKLLDERYDAVGGREIFLSQEDISSDILAGFLRLRIPSIHAHRKEVDSKTALIRELHVYGSLVPIGEKKEGVGQHIGYGEELLEEAEKIALEEFDKNKIIITSGIGVRNYYRKFGYEREGPYMAKKLN